MIPTRAGQNLGRKRTGSGADATNMQESRSYDGCQGGADDNGASDN